MSDPNPALAEAQTTAMRAMSDAYRSGKLKGFGLGYAAAVVATRKPERNDLVDLLERQLTETRGAHAAVVAENAELRLERRKLEAAREVIAMRLEEKYKARLKASNGLPGNPEWAELCGYTEALHWAKRQLEW